MIVVSDTSPLNYLSRDSLRGAATIGLPMQDKKITGRMCSVENV